jgi:hypothetical protein
VVYRYDVVQLLEEELNAHMEFLEETAAIKMQARVVRTPDQRPTIV